MIIEKVWEDYDTYPAVEKICGFMNENYKDFWEKIWLSGDIFSVFSRSLTSSDKRSYEESSLFEKTWHDVILIAGSVLDE